ncbi:MAG: Asp-tRNA(Asn)/Glu-tRNA(Gln) amidotransferase subunit GatC [Candidatus Roizmanbacteria bacterium]
MSKTTTLSKDDILHLGKLANLSLSESDVDMLSTQLSETLKYIQNLEELDTKSVDAIRAVAKNVTFEDGTLNERGFSSTEALQNSKLIKENMFVVKRIM